MVRPLRAPNRYATQWSSPWGTPTRHVDHKSSQTEQPHMGQAPADANPSNLAWVRPLRAPTNQGAGMLAKYSLNDATLSAARLCPRMVANVREGETMQHNKNTPHTQHCDRTLVKPATAPPPASSPPPPPQARKSNNHPARGSGR